MPPVINPVLVEMQPTVDNYAELADRVRQADVDECKASGWSPRDALWFALADCPEGCAAVGSLVRGSSKPVIVGAFGYNHRNVIWSLWADLSFRETKEMLRNSTPTLQLVLQRAGRETLWNKVSLLNEGALAWMNRLPAIQIDHHNVTRYGETPFVNFLAKRL